LILLATGFAGIHQSIAEEQSAPGSDSIKVTLLGTGTPQLNPRRMSYSTLIEAGDEVLLFDAGRAAMLQAKKSGADLKKLADRISCSVIQGHADECLGTKRS
jgi:metal-dependent hydrolase (beta-lactamase superfamily II)